MLSSHLAYPDFGKDFVLQTDASDYGVGAVLSQLDDSGHEKVIAYASKALTPREQKYSTTEKEALAVVFGTAHLRVYLLGRHFKLITDHNALRWLHTMEAKGRLARWIMDLQEFDFSVVHRAGRIHNNADAISRLVQPKMPDGTTTYRRSRRNLVDVHDHPGATCTSPQKVNQIDAITLNIRYTEILENRYGPMQNLLSQLVFFASGHISNQCYLILKEDS